MKEPLIMDEQDKIDCYKVQMRARSRADLRLKQLAAALLSRLDDMTTDDFSRGAEKPEREALRKAIDESESGGGAVLHQLVRLPVDYRKLTWQERKAARNEYVRLQNGKCHHCGRPLTGTASDSIMRVKIKKHIFPKNFFEWPVHLHHDHDTGMTIGAVHCHCNAVLWQEHGE